MYVNLVDNGMPITVRAASALTLSYVAGTVIDSSTNKLSAANQAVVLLTLTLGSATEIDMKVEFSMDGITYFQETMSAASSGVQTDTLLTHKYTSSGSFWVYLPIKANYTRISMQAAGSAAGTSATVQVVLGQN